MVVCSISVLRSEPTPCSVPSARRWGTSCSTGARFLLAWAARGQVSLALGDRWAAGLVLGFGTDSRGTGDHFIDRGPQRRRTPVFRSPGTRPSRVRRVRLELGGSRGWIDRGARLDGELRPRRRQDRPCIRSTVCSRGGCARRLQAGRRPAARAGPRDWRSCGFLEPRPSRPGRDCPWRRLLSSHGIRKARFRLGRLRRAIRPVALPLRGAVGSLAPGAYPQGPVLIRENHRRGDPPRVP